MSNLALALSLAERGWFVFPCRTEDKRPIVEGGFHASTTDPAQVRKWWTKHPDALIGIACKKSGIFALDIDKNHTEGVDGWKTLQRIAKASTGQPYPFPAAAQKTPSGGYHFLFTYPDGIHVKNNSGRLGAGLDLRSDGYICTGRLNKTEGYKWRQGVDFATVEIGPAPAWLLEKINALNEPKRPALSPGTNPVSTPEPSDAVAYWLDWALVRATNGNRNETLYQMGLQLNWADVPLAEAIGVATSFARVKGLTEKEAINTMTSAYNAPKREPATLPGSRSREHSIAPDLHQPIPNQNGKQAGQPAQQATTKTPAPSHADLAEVVVAGWNGATMYGLSDWRRYDGGVWPAEEEDIIKAEVMAVVKAAQVQGVRPTNGTVESVMELARLDVITRTKVWDADPDMLPVQNGVLHIPSLTIYPHAPENYFTYRTAYNYNPKATAEAWRYSLESTHDEETQQFLQEWAGYCLTTDVRYEIAVWLYGKKGSGKSTYIEGLRAMLGDRAGLLGLADVERSRFALAGVVGKTMLSATEQPAMYMQRAELLNTIISGEPLTVEKKFKNPVEITPFAKILWAMNDLPRVAESGNGIFRRVKVVKFPDRPEAQRDPRVKEAIKQEGSGILNWALEGLARLRERGGFIIPKAVQEASERFEKTNNIPAMFLEDRCVTGPSYKAQGDPLYQSYRSWCLENGHQPLSSTKLAEEWEVMGFTRYRANGKSYWRGVGLLE